MMTIETYNSTEIQLLNRTSADSLNKFLDRQPPSFAHQPLEKVLDWWTDQCAHVMASLHKTQDIAGGHLSAKIAAEALAKLSESTYIQEKFNQKFNQKKVKL